MAGSVGYTTASVSLAALAEFERLTAEGALINLA